MYEKYQYLIFVYPYWFYIYKFINIVFIAQYMVTFGEFSMCILKVTFTHWNYTTLMKEAIEETKMEKTSCVKWLKKINIKMSILPTVTYRVHEILINIPMVFFIEIGQSYLKCIWNHKEPKEPKPMFIRLKLEESYSLISKYIINLYY